MTTQTTTINLYGVRLEIEYTLSGGYIPETRYSPAEYPDANIVSIKSDDDISTLLERFDEIIYEKLNDEL